MTQHKNNMITLDIKHTVEGLETQHDVAIQPRQESYDVREKNATQRAE